MSPVAMLSSNQAMHSLPSVLNKPKLFAVSNGPASNGTTVSSQEIKLLRPANATATSAIDGGKQCKVIAWQQHKTAGSFIKDILFL